MKGGTGVRFWGGEGSGGSEMERTAFCISLAMIGFFLRLYRRGLFSMHSLLVCFICPLSPPITYVCTFRIIAMACKLR